MNNKGQTLVFFVILVPLVLAICAFAFDSAYILIKDNELESIAKSSVKSIMEDGANYDKVISVIKENDSNIEIIDINANSIHLKNKIDPIFGQIIGYDKYNLETKMIGKYENDKLVIEEKGQ